jgi:hypothetical protein
MLKDESLTEDGLRDHLACEGGSGGVELFDCFSTRNQDGHSRDTGITAELADGESYCRMGTL